jgi:hypothetical protein
MSSSSSSAAASASSSSGLALGPCAILSINAGGTIIQTTWATVKKPRAGSAWARAVGMYQEVTVQTRALNTDGFVRALLAAPTTVDRMAFQGGGQELHFTYFLDEDAAVVRSFINSLRYPSVAVEGGGSLPHRAMLADFLQRVVGVRGAFLATTVGAETLCGPPPVGGSASLSMTGGRGQAGSVAAAASAASPGGGAGGGGGGGGGGAGPSSPAPHAGGGMHVRMNEGHGADGSGSGSGGGGGEAHAQSGPHEGEGGRGGEGGGGSHATLRPLHREGSAATLPASPVPGPSPHPPLTHQASQGLPPGAPPGGGRMPPGLRNIMALQNASKSFRVPPQA